MPDQNQNSQNINSLPGNLRTLKTDVEEFNNSPQDRLQQAGNFIQAIPTLELNSTINSTTPVTPSTTAIENKVVEKKDIPSNEVNSKPNYSWSNMSSSQSNTSKIDTNINFSTVSSNSNKSGFSVLDDTIDLPLNNSLNKDINISSNENTLNTNTVPNDSNIDNLNKIRDIGVKPKSSFKPIISGIVVIVLLVLIGGGIYIFNTSRTTINTNTTNNTEQPLASTPNPEPSITPIEAPLFENIPKLDVAFVDSEPIRRTISSLLADKKDTLIELNLIKDGNKISLLDISTVFGLNIPFINDIRQYWFYAYNQEGVYKLTAVLNINDDKDIINELDKWSVSMPRDLSGFSINLPSRIVNLPTMKKTSVTNSSGNIFNNYYYNYTSSSDSIDVSSYKNYILMASSQNSMKYILDKIK
jgi:hypothetical protein